MDDFQFLELTLSKEECDGPNFYTVPVCSLCESSYTRVVCCECLNSGQFHTSKDKKSSSSYLELSQEIAKNNSRFRELNPRFNAIFKKLLDFGGRDSSQLAGLEEELKIINDNITNWVVALNEKKRKLQQLKQRKSNVISSSKKLAFETHRMAAHQSKLKHSCECIFYNFQQCNRRLYDEKAKCIQQLFNDFLPIKASIPPSGLDSIANTFLDMESRLLSVPEPTIRSHAALTHMLVAVRAVAQVLNIRIPLDITRVFKLNVLNDPLPLRDSITRVYRVVCHLVQFLVDSTGRSISPSSFPGEGGKTALTLRRHYRPLLTLLALAEAFKGPPPDSWSYDEPYFLSLSDVVSAIANEVAQCPQTLRASVPKRPVLVHFTVAGQQPNRQPLIDLDAFNSPGDNPDLRDWDIIPSDVGE